jgi:hypothetical protein
VIACRSSVLSEDLLRSKRRPRGKQRALGCEDENNSQIRCCVSWSGRLLLLPRSRSGWWSSTQCSGYQRISCGSTNRSCWCLTAIATLVVLMRPHGDVGSAPSLAAAWRTIPKSPAAAGTPISPIGCGVVDINHGLRNANRHRCLRAALGGSRHDGGVRDTARCLAGKYCAIIPPQASHRQLHRSIRAVGLPAGRLGPSLPCRGQPPYGVGGWRSRR